MKIHQYAILCAPIMGQDAAIEALERGEESMLKMRREYEMRRNYILRGFNDLGLECFKPRGAFYVFPKIASTGLTSREFSLQLLRKRKSPWFQAVRLARAAKAMCAAATPLRSIRSKSLSNELRNFAAALAPIRRRPRAVYDCFYDISYKYNSNCGAKRGAEQICLVVSDPCGTSL